MTRAAEVLKNVAVYGPYSAEVFDCAQEQVEALLIHGSEHGVAILADGSLRPLTEGEGT